MNIQQYYRIAANVALNGSIAALIPIIVIVCGGIYFSVDLPLLLMAVPFCLYSFICYQYYLIQQNRSAQVKMVAVDGRTISEANHLFITFLPAPSLRMLLFDENGLLVGEIRDKWFWWWRWFLPYFIDRRFPCWYGIYDGQNQLMGFYQINDRRKIVKIMDRDRQVIAVFNQESQQSRTLTRKGTILPRRTNEKIYIEASSVCPDVKLRNQNGSIVGKLIKGWMPLEWGNHFRDANTPYITFSENLNKDEKIMAIGVLVEYYRYCSH